MSDSVLITGGNRGIGLEFSRQYLEAGWQVYSTAREPGEAVELTSLQSEYPENLKIMKLDITNEDSVEAVGRTLERIERRLDLLLNNAGAYGSTSSFLELEVEDLREIIDVNCFGSFRLTQRLFPLVKAARGNIVFITSLMGSIGDNRSGGSYPYRISKAALNMLGKNISEDFRADEVFTLLLHPGWVKTRMGGEDAKVDVETSVSGMREVISGLDREISGQFYGYDGQPRPW